MVTAIGIVGVIGMISSHASAAVPEIKSGIAGACLDVYHDSSSPNAIVDASDCNSSAAQVWTRDLTILKHGDTSCLTLTNPSTTKQITTETCDGSAYQVWLPENTALLNPATGFCLSVPQSKLAVQLTAQACIAASVANQTWFVAPGNSPAAVDDQPANCQKDSPRLRIACDAVSQWSAWTAAGSNHQALLNTYSDGNGYEEWCADFVSYIFKQAGIPFSNGERSGWDEYDANNITYQGFTRHDAGTGYIPQTGDVAFFDYPGGHVEIVVSGGVQPTFIYGDSGTTDPETGNGEMAANTLLSDGDRGQISYYLSPKL